MAPRTPVALRNTDADFYPALGPFLADRAVHRALGGVPWDDDNKIWLVLKTAGAVTGFCGVTEGARRTVLESLYVLPDREKDVPLLLAAAVEHFGHDRDLHTTVRNDKVPAHQQVGFAVVKEMTDYQILVRRADVRNTK